MKERIDPDHHATAEEVREEYWSKYGHLADEYHPRRVEGTRGPKKTGITYVANELSRQAREGRHPYRARQHLQRALLHQKLSSSEARSWGVRIADKMARWESDNPEMEEEWKRVHSILSTLGNRMSTSRIDNLKALRTELMRPTGESDSHVLDEPFLGALTTNEHVLFELAQRLGIQNIDDLTPTVLTKIGTQCFTLSPIGAGDVPTYNEINDFLVHRYTANLTRIRDLDEQGNLENIRQSPVNEVFAEGIADMPVVALVDDEGDHVISCGFMPRAENDKSFMPPRFKQGPDEKISFPFFRLSLDIGIPHNFSQKELATHLAHTLSSFHDHEEVGVADSHLPNNVDQPPHTQHVWRYTP